MIVDIPEFIALDDQLNSTDRPAHLQAASRVADLQGVLQTKANNTDPTKPEIYSTVPEQTRTASAPFRSVW